MLFQMCCFSQLYLSSRIWYFYNFLSFHISIPDSMLSCSQHCSTLLPSRGSVCSYCILHIKSKVCPTHHEHIHHLDLSITASHTQFLNFKSKNYILYQIAVSFFSLPLITLFLPQLYFPHFSYLLLDCILSLLILPSAVNSYSCVL